MEVPGYQGAVEELRKTLTLHPELKEKAANLGVLYQGRRGLMVVDVVASRQRRYESYVTPKILPLYIAEAKDLSLTTLARNPPEWLPLKANEANTMSAVAEQILLAGSLDLTTDDEKCLAWATDTQAVHQMLQVYGMGPALLEYLRMLCGADSLKVDVRVINGMKAAGIETEWFTPTGLLALAKEMSRDIPCSLLELDQCLWHVVGNSK